MAALILSFAAIFLYKGCREQELRDLLASKTWKFVRSDGSVIAPSIRLLENRKISGYHHPSESAWDVRNFNLVFLSDRRKPTTNFDTMRLENGRWKLEGDYLGSERRNANHLLIEIDGPSSPSHTDPASVDRARKILALLWLTSGALAAALALLALFR